MTINDGSAHQKKEQKKRENFSSHVGICEMRRLRWPDSAYSFFSSLSLPFALSTFWQIASKKFLVIFGSENLLRKIFTLFE